MAAPIVQIISVPEKENCCYLAHGKYISFLAADKVSAVYSGKSPITRAVAISPDGKQLVLVDASKAVRLFSISTATQDQPELIEVATGMVDKAAMSVVFEPLTGNILVGDKFGDVIRFPPVTATSDGPWVGSVIAGCVSTVTDLAVTADNQLILMADRDEKIRLISAAKPYVIEGFCLEHTEYVAAIKLIGEQQLVSIGGDARLCLWDLRENTTDPRQVVVLKDQLPGRFDPIGMAVVSSSVAIALDDNNTLFILGQESDSGQFSEESLKRILLPEGFRPSAIAAHSADSVFVGGLCATGEPSLLKVNIQAEVVEEIESFRSFFLPLERVSLTWSQIVRSHLRKRRVFTYHNNKKRKAEEGEEQEGEGEGEGEEGKDIHEDLNDGEDVLDDEEDEE